MILFLSGKTRRSDGKKEVAEAEEQARADAAAEEEARVSAAQEEARAEEADHFAAIDEDGSGNITLEEMRAAMQEKNSAVTEEQVQKRWAELDLNKDGKVSKQEFAEAMKTAADDKTAAEREATVGRKVRKWYEDENYADSEEEAEEGTDGAGKDYDGTIAEIWEDGTGRKMWRVEFEGHEEDDFNAAEIMEILLPEGA